MRRDPNPPLRMTSPVHSEDGADSAYASMMSDETESIAPAKARCSFTFVPQKTTSPGPSAAAAAANAALGSQGYQGSGAAGASAGVPVAMGRHRSFGPLHNSNNAALKKGNSPPPNPAFSASLPVSSQDFSLAALKRQMDTAFGFAHGFEIKVLGIPMQNARSRVETQTKLCLQMVDANGNKTSTWSHLRLPELLVTKEKLRKSQTIIDYSLIPHNKVLDLQAVIICASDPAKNVQICSGCQQRENKRSKKKSEQSAAASNAEVKLEDSAAPTSAEKVAEGAEMDAGKIVLFNCSSYVDFSSGDTILPTRITCYCRHHNEKIGFCVYFIARDHNSCIVATGISPPILITDDHKGTKSKPPGMAAVAVPSSLASPPAPISAVSPSTIIPGGHKRARTDEPADVPMPDAPVSPPNTILRPQTDFQDDVIAQFIPALLASDTSAPLFENFGIRQQDPDFRRSKKQYQSPPPTQAFSPVAPAAVINRIIPGEGPIQGGVEITILGDNMHNGLIVVFGDMEAVTTQVWGSSTMICVLPPSSTPGPVPVTLKAIAGFNGSGASAPGTPDIPVTFMYKDDLDRSLMELALQVVGLRMTGSLDSARNIAMRIVNETAQETMNDAALSFNELPRNQLETSIINAFLSLEEHTDELDTIVLTSLLDMTFDSCGLNLLHLASCAGMTTLVKYLLSMDCDVNPRDKNGFTPLMFAVHAQNYGITSILLQAGASRVLTSRNNVSCFHLAKRHGTEYFNQLVEFIRKVPEEDEEHCEEMFAAFMEAADDVAVEAVVPQVADEIQAPTRRVSCPDISSSAPISPAFVPSLPPLCPSFEIPDAVPIEEMMAPLPPAMEMSKRSNGKKGDVKGAVDAVRMRWANPEAELKNIMDGFKAFAFLGPLVHTIATPLIVQRVDVDFSHFNIESMFEYSDDAKKQPLVSLDETVSVPFSGYVEREEDCDCQTWSNGMGYHEGTCKKVMNVIKKQQKRIRRQQRALWLFWLPLVTAIVLLLLFRLFLSNDELDAVLAKIVTWNAGVATQVKDAVHGLRRESKNMFFDFLNGGI
ncbi:hypothetical protein BC830DRAFT_1131641 [Chytriomyces sp. MP71]|nr:hypothetical protein BC830DRAFT_1131641 [Chytriomyces sp. MP71]